MLGDGYGQFRADAKIWADWKREIDQRLAPFVSVSKSLNLPSNVKSRARELRAEINRVLTSMGPQAEFTRAPSFGHGMASFDFSTPQAYVSVLIMEMNSEHTGTPQMSLTVTPMTKEGKAQLEAKRFRSIMFSQKGPEALTGEQTRGWTRHGELGHDFFSVEYRDSVGDLPSKQKVLSSVQLYKLPQTRRWVAFEWQGKKAKRLRSKLVVEGGKEVPLGRDVANRLFHYNRHELYLPLAKDHPDYASGMDEYRSVSSNRLTKHGVQVVVDKRGRSYLRRGKGFNAQGLRRDLGLAFVKRSVTGHRAHLRQLRPTQR